jgi:RNA polymerase sigma-70 factor, ECF subfamily
MRARRLTHDADQWRLWLRRHGPALLLFARQWSLTRADAEDAVQNGFINFWKTRRRARDEVAYLYCCVRGAAMDLGRGERRRTKRQREASRAEESAFEPTLERSERQQRIEVALNQLPSDQREVVALKIWGELTFAQISEVLEIAPGTAASRYRLALNRLFADLAEEVTYD